jgi:small subunit ribosomal protein S13
MARIAGVDIPRNKKIEVSITYIFGIGRSNGMDVLRKANVNPSVRVRDLTEEEVSRIREVVEREYRVEGDLRREIQLNIKRLMDIGCYRGLRHRKGMPVRGQRTRTNARTRRGRRGQAIGIKKKTAKK